MENSRIAAQAIEYAKFQDRVLSSKWKIIESEDKKHNILLPLCETYSDFPNFDADDAIVLGTWAVSLDVMRHICDVHNEYIENVSPSPIIDSEWEVSICHSGEICWCREIKTKDGELIVPFSILSKKYAEHIVFIHNKNRA